MNTKTALLSLDSKIKELNGILDDLQKNKKLSANTVRTQTFQKKHELHNLLIMKDLLNNLARHNVEDVFDAEAIKDWFESATTLTAARKAKYEITVKEGDMVVDVLQANGQMKNVWERLMKAADEAGLHIEDGKLVK